MNFYSVFTSIITVAMILTGIFFLMSSATDIQLGFGLILLFMGLNNIAQFGKFSHESK